MVFFTMVEEATGSFSMLHGKVRYIYTFQKVTNSKDLEEFGTGSLFHCSSKASLLHLFTVIVHKDSLAWLLTQLKADATDPFLFLNGSLTLKSEWLCDGFPLRAQSIQSMIC